ncbi:LicD family protein [Clostridium paraputrificum]|uniref:LicD family protein n=1 Tax=Clostridium TaxID=1485 RepID=UPI003D34F82B
MGMEIKELQRIILEIMKDVDKLCKENNIEYWISGGTLLGAVRHKGFIPWDDDLDIGMLREEYDKFIGLCREKLPNYLEMQNYITDETTPFSWTKIRYKNSIFYENGFRNREKFNGVFIDVFPMDVFENIEERLEFKKKYKKVKMVASGEGAIERPIFANKDINIKFLIQNIGSMMFLGKKKEDYYKELVKIAPDFCLKEYNKDTAYVDYGVETPYYTEIVKYNDIFPLIELDFEGTKLLAPKNYKKCLEVTFGSSYMELPPEGERVWHHKGYYIDENGYYSK